MIEGAGYFRQLSAWLYRAHQLGARNDFCFAQLLPDVKTLLNVMQDFEEAGTRVCCKLSRENPEDDTALGGFVFLAGVMAEHEREQWLRRVIWLNKG